MCPAAGFRMNKHAFRRSSVAQRGVLLVFLSTSISLATCETVLRLLGYTLRPGARAWEVDEGVAWTKINSHGYRDRERTATKPQEVYRVAVLGDSWTEARQVGIDKMFTTIAEAELNRVRSRDGSLLYAVRHTSNGMWELGSSFSRPAAQNEVPAVARYRSRSKSTAASPFFAICVSKKLTILSRRASSPSISREFR